MRNSLSLNHSSRAPYGFKDMKVYYSNVLNKVIIGNKLANEVQYNLTKIKMVL